jgi:hypothetical protein
MNQPVSNLPLKVLETLPVLLDQVVQPLEVSLGKRFYDVRSKEKKGMRYLYMNISLILPNSFFNQSKGKRDN